MSVGAHVYQPPPLELWGFVRGSYRVRCSAAFFEAFSHIMHIFGGVEPWIGFGFAIPFRYSTIFGTHQSLESPTLQSGGGGRGKGEVRHVPTGFLCGIRCSTAFG